MNQRPAWIVGIGLLILIFIASSAQADSPGWYASSTGFFIHSQAISTGGGNSTYTFSTSTSFKLIGAGSEAGLGTSTSASFGLLGGFLRNLYRSPAPSYEEIHYHWRNNDGTEATASSGTSGAQDTATSSIPKGDTKRVRIEIANRGGTILGYSSQQFRLEYGLKTTTCAAISSWTDVGAANGDWDMVDSASLTDGANTTNIALSQGGVDDYNSVFLSTNGGVKDTGSQTAAISVPSNAFIELEYSIKALSFATDGGTYCFRVTNAGSATNYTYTSYPLATVAGGTSLTFVLDGSSESFPALTPGTLVATSSILSVNTTNATGFNVSVARNNGSATLLLTGDSSVSIPDKTAWSPGASCGTAGNATASTTNANTLEFRVRQAGTDSGNFCSAWWGSADTTAAALFGGFPSSAQQIVNRSSASSPTTTAVILYNLNVPNTQKTGTYTGSITYTITANP